MTWSCLHTNCEVISFLLIIQVPKRVAVELPLKVLVLIRALQFSRMQKWEAPVYGSYATAANHASRERPPGYHAPGP